MLKKCKIVMLPTNQQTKYLMVYSDVEKTKGKLILNGLKNDEYKEYQHLYIISDDEIKEGDWFYNIHSKIVGKAAFNFGKDGLAKKIIATTDSSLTLYMGGYNMGKSLPQPSQQFIQKYIEEYNKGNVITDVLVEYGIIYEGRSYDLYNPDKLKVNLKNNTITIKKVKDSWNREEILNDIEQAIIQGLDIGQYRDKWIKENL